MSRARNVWWGRVARLGGALCLCAMWAGACATKAPPPLVPGAPHYPDFAFPTDVASPGDARLKARHAAAWQSLQAGDIRTASREFSEILRRTPSFYPAQAGLGYALVAEGRQKDALAQFDRVLQRAPGYAPALAGRGEALLGTGQTDLAIASFEAARAADAGLSDLPRRIDVLRFGRVNELVASANRAAAAGRLDEAGRAYERALAASPDSAFLLRDLALVELRAGATDVAIEHLRKALASEPDDVRAWLALAEAHEKGGNLMEAIVALERVTALEPTEPNRKALERVRDRAELARLPGEYRAIASAAQITRGDLAALLGVRLVPLLPAARRGTGVVVTDARAHWASTWILSVTRAALMDAYPNHTFQPHTVVRRVDLALVVSRVLALVPRQASRAPRLTIADVSADHLRYAAVAAAVGSGVMTLVDGNSFRPSRVVSGVEAAEVVGRLESLARRNRGTAAPRN